MINFKLTEKQKKAYPAIKWLLGNGPKADGKTTLMALAFLERAIDNKGEWVRCFDHFRHVDATRHVVFHVQMLFDGLENKNDFILKIRNDDSIQVTLA